MSTNNETDYRLSYAVAPRRYELQLTPDLAAATFAGIEQLELEVLEPLTRIVMNAAELEIEGATISAVGTADAVACAIEFDTDHERVAFIAPHELVVGSYLLACTFRGELNDKLRGFYRSRFIDDTGTEHLIATTQFEATDARRAFPCFDEPDRKAVFSITLDAPAGMLAISNGEEIGVAELGEGRRRLRFADTIVMSTYLVAFVVGPLEATEPVDVGGVALRVVHAPGKAHLTPPAIEVATHALRYFSDYFAIPYPGNKVDLVAVPDFAAGAMENLGCVTFRDAILLADPTSTSQAEMERMAEVVEHELAHMWFGDLVTMSWWNGIWLNEAFATFMALRCQDNFRPEWESFVSFARGKSAALAIDGLHSTRPIEFPVHAPEESSAMFDVLTYEKGASVLWMIEQFLGEDRFRDGVRHYLAAHAFANTETTDLWDAIETEAGDIPIRAVMDSWIYQGGFPLISVARSAPDEVSLSQEPFAYLPEPSWGDSAIGRDWLIPVRIAPPGQGGAASAVLIESTPVSYPHHEGALVVNAGGSGFYRLRYDEELRDALLASLDALQPLERYNLVGDNWASVIATKSPLDDFFEIIGHLSDEHDPHVWSIVIGAIAMFDLVVHEADRPLLAAATRAMLGPQLDRIGWQAGEDEDDQTPLLRASLISTLGTIGDDTDVVQFARRLFAGDHDGSSPVAADLAGAVLAIVAAHATPDEFAAIRARQQQPQSPLDENRHLNALASVTDRKFADTVRGLCLTEIRSQNAPYLIASMLRNRSTGGDTWTFITAHFPELLDRFPETSIHRMLDGITALVTLDDAGASLYLPAVRAFVADNIDGGRRRLVEQSIERLAINVNFAKAVRDQLPALLVAVRDRLSPQ